MTTLPRPAFLALLIAALLSTKPATLPAAEKTEQVVSVSKTYNDSPFDYRMKPLFENESYNVYRLTYPSPVVTPVKQNNTIPADYYIPKGIKPGDPKRPAVICLHILAGNYELVHMTCSLLASRGIPAIMFKLPYYGERGMPGGPKALLDKPRLLLDSFPQGIEDVRRTVDLLASREEVDPRLIGITGISLGGIMGASAAEAEPRLQRAVLILAGGDLPTIIHHARETKDLSKLIKTLSPAELAELQRTIKAIDPLGRADKLRDRARAGKVLMINATEDDVVPPPCTEKLAAALGISDKVMWLKGLGHYTAMVALPRVMETTARFFERDMPKGTLAGKGQAAKPAKPNGRTPMQRVVAFVRQLSVLLTVPPKAGKCHYADLDIAVSIRGGETFKSRLRFIRGAGYKFRLEARVPHFGDVALGQCDYPWIASVKETVFVGGKSDGGRPGNPLAGVDPAHMLKLRMATGALGAVALTPSILDQLITVSDEPAADRAPALRIEIKEKKNKKMSTARLLFQDDGTTPRSLTFDLTEATGSVEFRIWRIDAIANKSLFEPPRDRPRQEVEAACLDKIFSATINFALEHVR